MDNSFTGRMANSMLVLFGSILAIGVLIGAGLMLLIPYLYHHIHIFWK